jgi:hypothetical protein
METRKPSSFRLKENYTMAKTPNYSADEATRLVELYDAHGNSKPAITLITETMNKEFPKAPGSERNERMILGKLINTLREDGTAVYIARDVVAKVAVDHGPTKKELLTALEVQIGNGFNATPLQGATKVGIESVIRAVTDLQAVEAVA